MLKEKILEIVSQELTDSQLVAAIEAAITTNTPFNHNIKEGVSVCGLDEETFIQKWINFEINANLFLN